MTYRLVGYVQELHIEVGRHLFRAVASFVTPYSPSKFSRQSARSTKMLPRVPRSIELRDSPVFIESRTESGWHCCMRNAQLRTSSPFNLVVYILVHACAGLRSVIDIILLDPCTGIGNGRAPPHICNSDGKVDPCCAFSGRMK